MPGASWVARVQGRPNRKRFPKDGFVIDLAQGTCTCPAGQITRVIVPPGKRTDGAGTTHHLRAFRFHAAVCWACPPRSQCIAAKGSKDRQVLIHAQQGLLQEARALQQSADCDQYRRRRAAAEHRLARLEQLGIRQARYFGLSMMGQHQVPAVLGGHRGQSDPAGQPNRRVRRS